MWQLIQDNFISHYHEYIGDLHHMLVALSKIQTFVFSWTPLHGDFPMITNLRVELRLKFEALVVVNEKLFCR